MTTPDPTPDRSRTATGDHPPTGSPSDRLLRTSTVLVPTLDEEAGVAAVIDAARTAGVERTLVVDSGSTDDTVDAALGAGAEVVRVEDLAPGGPSRGKGDTLWRALPLVTSPWTIFLDGDLTIDGPDFLARLVAPLATEGRLFSKASFRRVRSDGVDDAAAPGGGRISTLVAGPLLELVRPALAAMPEPLSGQVAAPTDLLRGLRFEVDYGLEIGMLVDVHDRFGPDAIAHPHCGVLAHVPQSDVALARMSTEVLRAALARSTPASFSATAGEHVRPPHLATQASPGGQPWVGSS